MLTKEDLDAIVKTMSPLIDARAKTTETLLKGVINDATNGAKEELRAEILAARTEAKADNLRILGKLDKQDARIENLEKETGTPNPHKN